MHTEGVKRYSALSRKEANSAKQKHCSVLLGVSRVKPYSEPTRVHQMLKYTMRTCVILGTIRKERPQNFRDFWPPHPHSVMKFGTKSTQPPHFVCFRTTLSPSQCGCLYEWPLMWPVWLRSWICIRKRTTVSKIHFTPTMPHWLMLVLLFLLPSGSSDDWPAEVFAWL